MIPNYQPNSLLLQVPSGGLRISHAAVQSDRSSHSNSLNKPEDVCCAIADHLNPIRFSLVIPTYNESKNIKEIVELLSQQLDKAIPGAYELIVVDDDSPDCTWAVALELMPQYPQLRVMRRVDERGLSTAVIRGWQAARGETLGVIDADLQHPPELLLKLWADIEKGADLAITSRNVEGGGVSDWSLIRRLLSRGAQTLGLMILPEVISR